MIGDEEINVKRFFEQYWKNLLFFAIVGLVGGFFVGIYTLDGYPEEMRLQLVAELDSLGVGQIPADIIIGIVTAVQSMGYGLILGALGILLGKKTGLWKDERKITKKPLTASIVISVLGGLAMILPDLLFFGKHSQAIVDSYVAKPDLVYILASITYGAVIEEVMLRLFAMSLIAFILYKLFGKNYDKPTTIMLIASNVIAALLFASGHLPATFIILGNSPMLIFRCFLLNGGLGLLFGYLYRKYGLRYAMIAHGGCHIVSKLIWILFI